MKMMWLLIHAHTIYNQYDNHVEWKKGATAKAKDTMALHNIRYWAELQSAMKWAWAGKLAQMHEGRWTNVISAWIPHTSRSRGRPKKGWVDDINGFLVQQTQSSYEGDAWRTLASNPWTWKNLSDTFVKHAVNER